MNTWKILYLSLLGLGAAAPQKAARSGHSHCIRQYSDIRCISFIFYPAFSLVPFIPLLSGLRLLLIGGGGVLRHNFNIKKSERNLSLPRSSESVMRGFAKKYYSLAWQSVSCSACDFLSINAAPPRKNLLWWGFRKAHLAHQRSRSSWWISGGHRSSWSSSRAPGWSGRPPRATSLGRSTWWRHLLPLRLSGIPDSKSSSRASLPREMFTCRATPRTIAFEMVRGGPAPGPPRRPMPSCRSSLGRRGTQGTSLGLEVGAAGYPDITVTDSEICFCWAKLNGIKQKKRKFSS